MLRTFIIFINMSSHRHAMNKQIFIAMAILAVLGLAAGALEPYVVQMAKAQGCNIGYEFSHGKCVHMTELGQKREGYIPPEHHEPPPPPEIEPHP
jgi:hypothetical protein